MHPTFSIRLTKKLMDIDMERCLALYEWRFPVVESSGPENLSATIDGPFL